MMGLLFLLMSCVYAMFSPVWGALADRIVSLLIGVMMLFHLCFNVLTDIDIV